MPAHDDNFPWMSYYGNYNFFVDRMKSHNKVQNVHAINKSCYEIALSNGNKLKVFICECYSFGLAEFYETIEKLGKLNAIIINSNWCGYTLEAKKHCRDQEVGLYDISGFMAALNMDKYWLYLTDREKIEFRKR